MKHFFLTTLFLLTSLTIHANQTYLYTFTSNPFNTSTITSSNTTASLNGRTIYIKTLNSASTNPTSANIQYVPGRGLRITAASNSIPYITLYTKTSDPTLSASIALETTRTLDSTSNILTFTEVGSISGTNPPTSQGINTYSHSYTNNTKGPKIIINLISPTDTIYIRSLQFTFASTSTNPTINLSYQSSTIGTFSSDTLPIPLPSITPADPRFSFAGWTTSSTLLTNSANAPSDLTNTLTSSSITNPSSSITLTPVFTHFRPNSTPTITAIPSFTTSTSISFPNDLLLTSLHYHIQGSSSIYHTYLSFSSQSYKISSNFSPDEALTTCFHELPINSFIPANTPINLSVERLHTSITVDSIVAITYPNPEPRYYTSIPNLTDSYNLTIDFPTTIPAEGSLTAIDALTYSMNIDDSRFYFLSLPFDAPFDLITISPISGPHPRTYYYGATATQYLGDYLFSEYDQTANTWHDIPLSQIQSTGLLANHGYLIGLTQTSTQATFTFRTANAPADQPHTVSTSQPETIISTPVSTTLSPALAGWNLIGNPYLTPLDPTQIYSSDNRRLNYVLIPNSNNSYDIVSPYAEELTTSIPPFTSFFIQSLTDNTLINPNNQSSITNYQSSNIYHFNILCTTPDSTTSVLTILSSNNFTEDYEPNFDLRSLSPETDITHDGLAIYASNLHPGDTIPLTLPTSDATLRLGNNINIPDSWTITIDHSIPAAIITDDTPSSLDQPTSDTSTDTIAAIYTIDGRQLPLNTTLQHGIYIIRYTSGRTSKTLIP